MSEPAVTLREGESAVFGYGSLLSRSSLERTLGRRYDGPFAPCTLPGWRRSWDAAMPNDTFYTLRDGGRLTPRFILYLNIRRDSPTAVNGVLFVVSEMELAALDDRETIYDRVSIAPALQGVHVTGGDAFVYVAKPEHTMQNVPSPEVAAVRATYVRIVESGLGAFSPEFAREYEHTSDAIPAGLVIEDKRG